MIISTHQGPSRRDVDENRDTYNRPDQFYESARHQSNDGTDDSEGKGQEKQR
jgi:hypothetical protein